MIKKLKENRVSRSYLGGKNIDLFLGKTKSEISLFPEDWTASLTSAYNSTDGHVEGLGETVDGEKLTDLLGDGKPNILVKLLDSAERLVIQAHPTVPFAKKFLNNDFGKTECWFFLDCEPDACVYIGFKEGALRSEWEKAFFENDSKKMLSMLHRLPVKKGDFVFVNGGMPHAIGKGCFMVELQEPSDLMVVNERFTPSGREIPEQRLTMGLPYDKMFDVYDYTGYSLEELKKVCCPERRNYSKNIFRILGPETTEKFSMYLMNADSELKTDLSFKVAIVILGEGTVNGQAAKKGDRFVLINEPSVAVSGNEKFELLICE